MLALNCMLSFAVSKTKKKIIVKLPQEIKRRAPWWIKKFMMKLHQEIWRRNSWWNYIKKFKYPKDSKFSSQDAAELQFDAVSVVIFCAYCSLSLHSVMRQSDSIICINDKFKQNVKKPILFKTLPYLPFTENWAVLFNGTAPFSVKGKVSSRA